MEQGEGPAVLAGLLLLGQVDAAEFLTGKSDAKECQRLVDALYDDTLLGEPSGPSALAGFQQGEQRLLYQVGAYDSTDLEKSMKWLGTLHESCDTFTLTGEGGGRRSVEVVEASLPKVGEARQGLSVRVKGTATASRSRSTWTSPRCGWARTPSPS